MATWSHRTGTSVQPNCLLSLIHHCHMDRTHCLHSIPCECPDLEFNLFMFPTQNPLVYKHERATETFPKTRAMAGVGGHKGGVYTAQPTASHLQFVIRHPGLPKFSWAPPTQAIPSVFLHAATSLTSFSTSSKIPTLNFSPFHFAINRYELRLHIYPSEGFAHDGSLG